MIDNSMSIVDQIIEVVEDHQKWVAEGTQGPKWTGECTGCHWRTGRRVSMWQSEWDNHLSDLVAPLLLQAQNEAWAAGCALGHMAQGTLRDKLALNPNKLQKEGK